MAWQIVATGVAGAVVSLVGVLTGAATTHRVQTLQWSRNRQADACAALVAESARVQHSLYHEWKHDERVDWAAWNEALAVVSLLCPPEVVAAAAKVDEAFWRHSRRNEAGEIADWEQWWTKAVVPMEAVRLDFINVARLDVIRTKTVVTQSPLGRPGPDTQDRGEPGATAGPT